MSQVAKEKSTTTKSEQLSEDRNIPAIKVNIPMPKGAKPPKKSSSNSSSSQSKKPS